MIEFLKVILSPHIVWGGILVFFAFRFKTAFGQLLSAITDRIKNVQGYKKTKEGHEVTFGNQQTEGSDKVLPNVSDKHPVGLPEKTSNSFWPEDNSDDVKTLRDIVKSERSIRYLWEYRYLNYFFAKPTQMVLDWLASREGSASVALYESFWFNLITEKQQRTTILDVLVAHYLIEVKESGIIELTPKGKEYHEWRGPLNQTETPPVDTVEG